jgi:hypothetical protein
MNEPFDLAKHRAEQERARALGLDYSEIRRILLSVGADGDDGISEGRAVELVREMALRAVDKAVAEERAEVVRLRERVEDYEDDVRRVLEDRGASDEVHCSCVPVLRAEVARLQAALEKAVAEERAAVVERLEVQAFLFNEHDAATETTLLRLAREVERGDHRRDNNGP